MNTPGEVEADREGNTRFSMAGKWVNRNERMRKKPVSRSSRAGLQVSGCRVSGVFFTVFGRVWGLFSHFRIFYFIRTNRIVILMTLFK